MSKIRYNGALWTPDNPVFASRMQAQGPLALWHGQNMGGTSAYALLGPDIERPGGRTHNPPNAVGAGWDQAWANGPPGGAGPNLCFTQDANNNWYRGHLINGEWDGSGANWNNLTPLTSQGNANHRTVETRMRVYLQNFRAFDTSANGHKTYWYALHYWVQVSTVPWAAAPAAAGNLYSYCPNMIRVTWRIVRINKPVAGLGTTPMVALATAGANIDAAAKPGATPAQIAVDLVNIPANNIPAALTNNAVNLAAVGGGVYALPPGAPPISPVASPYDGSVEIFQD